MAARTLATGVDEPRPEAAPAPPADAAAAAKDEAAERRRHAWRAALLTVVSGVALLAGGGSRGDVFSTIVGQVAGTAASDAAMSAIDLITGA